MMSLVIYKNTINLLRSQLEIKNVGMANHNQGHHCCSQTQPTKESHIETKIEGLLEKFKHELEIRDIKLEHKMVPFTIFCFCTIAVAVTCMWLYPEL
jgi:hypothetical protein